MLQGIVAVAMALVTFGQVLAPTWYGAPPLAPSWPDMGYLGGLVQATATWLVMILATLLFTATNLLDYQKTQAVQIIAVIVVRSIMTFSAIRLGLLATIVAFVVVITLQGAPLTADSTE